MTISQQSILGLVFLSFASGALASDLVYAPKNQLRASITVGFGGIENPINSAKNITTPVLPAISYFGEDWYFSNSTLGYSLHESAWYLDIAGTLNEDGLFFELDGVSNLLVVYSLNNSLPSGTPLHLKPIKRKLSYMAGLIGGTRVNDFGIEFAALHDVTGVHDGYEFIFNTNYAITLGKAQLLFEPSVRYKSQQLIDYYYTVSPSEAISRLPPYQLPNHAINYQFGIAYELPFSDSWSLTLKLQKHWIDGKLSSTPMFVQSVYYSGFAGLKFEF
ncbi:MipA/OmpV family protein [Pseudoalteromonas fenneropenaei]|uniref:MipA/OmpV family protein n=1 Tax=Pseudoalteromonas fenneropenaei TaxID=1737459 RepID=A0ABV7CEG4_9GAMM